MAEGGGLGEGGECCEGREEGGEMHFLGWCGFGLLVDWGSGFEAEGGWKRSTRGRYI